MKRVRLNATEEPKVGQQQNKFRGRGIKTGCVKSICINNKALISRFWLWRNSVGMNSETSPEGRNRADFWEMRWKGEGYGRGEVAIQCKGLDCGGRRDQMEYCWRPRIREYVTTMAGKGESEMEEMLNHCRV